jgi:hypothetical protein
MIKLKVLLFEGMTDTPEFKQWFGQSKVVDEHGQPKVVYHGTSKSRDFSKFNKKGGGSWFTSSKEEASKYAERNDFSDIRGHDEHGVPYGSNVSSRIYPVYLKIENPKLLTSKEIEWWRHQKDYRSANKELLARAFAAGHDGIDMGNGNYVVHKPEQIKSAIGNKGMFDPKHPDITKETI